MANPENIENTIRKVIREEMSKPNCSGNSNGGPSANGGGNLYARTQSLIRSAAQRASSSTAPNTENSTGHKRSLPGHPFRYAAAKKTNRSGGSSKGKMLNVILLPQNLDEEEGYRADCDNELLSGYMEIQPSYTETTIRKNLVKVFRVKYSLISSNDFEFVKRVKNKVSKPSVPEDFEWGYDAVKALAGQGKLCCRLLVDPSVLINFDGEDSFDDVLAQPTFSRSSALPVSSTITQVSAQLSVAQEQQQSVSDLQHHRGQHNSGLHSDKSNIKTSEEHNYSAPLHPVIDLTKEEDGVHEILVHRSKLRDDLITEFANNEILTKKINFGVVGFNGQLEPGQGAGVLREVLSSFFEDFYSSCCGGAEELVPIVRHDMSEVEWNAVARVIIFAIKHDYFPVRISPAFLKSSFLGDIVLREELISSFKQYISSEEKEILERNLKEFNEDTDELLDVLSAFKCHTLPTKDNVENIVCQLAHQELIQKPKYIAECFYKVFKSVRFPSKFSPFEIQKFYEKKIPSGRKVTNLFESTPTNAEEVETIDHLKRYVKNLRLENLRKLLRLMTGSDLIVTDKIGITFTGATGLLRRPIFHTCGPTMELPRTYCSYNELAEEFNSLISNPIGSFSFDIV